MSIPVVAGVSGVSECGSHGVKTMKTQRNKTSQLTPGGNTCHVPRFICIHPFINSFIHPSNSFSVYPSFIHSFLHVHLSAPATTSGRPPQATKKQEKNMIGFVYIYLLDDMI